MYYRNTISKLQEDIRTKHPGITPEFSELQTHKSPPISYLLWMCEEVSKMDPSSLDEALKAGRWMGWIFAHVELLGIWTNAETREYVREDRKQGLDRPH